jgi:hypothetical protein
MGVEDDFLVSLCRRLQLRRGSDPGSRADAGSRSLGRERDGKERRN